MTYFNLKGQGMFEANDGWDDLVLESERATLTAASTATLTGDFSSVGMVACGAGCWVMKVSTGLAMLTGVWICTAGAILAWALGLIWGTLKVRIVHGWNP